jgi:hypothetical protein
LGDFVKGSCIGFLQRQIQQNPAFLQVFPQFFKAIDFMGDGSSFLQYRFGIFRIVPEAVPGNCYLNFSQSLFKAI